MKVEEPTPIQSVRQVGLGRSVPAANSLETPQREDGQRDDQELPHDVAAVHGVDEGELTPGVRHAMEGLIAEVAQLREELAQTKRRLEYLNVLADQDPLSATLNRRAFVRELSRALALAQRQDADSTLIFLEVDNLKAVNVHQGMAAGDAAIEHVSGIIQSRLDEGTVIGRLGGAEFGLVLIGEEPELARNRGNAIAAAVAAQPLNWDGQEIWLTLRFGVHPLRSGEDASAAMIATDRVLRHGGPYTAGTGEMERTGELNGG
jgi:diguanylate cyclase (GGDEF)-like protein